MKLIRQNLDLIRFFTMSFLAFSALSTPVLGNDLIAPKPDLNGFDKFNQIITAPGATTNYYILSLPGEDSNGDPNMEIWARAKTKSSYIVLLKSHPSDDPTQNLTAFRNLFLSPDGKIIYFESKAWTTSNAIHAINIASKKVTYVVPGEIACVVLAGDFKGDLIVEQHRYFVQAGSYDNLWLFTPTGQELGLVSEDTDASMVCPNLSN